MTLAEAEEYLLGLEQFGMRFGLDRMQALLTALGEPQRRFGSVHVVGTNGKSSTARFTAAILERVGVRTGTYTSPHLRSFRERIEVGEEPVSPERFAAAVGRAAAAAREVDDGRDADDRVTQFEALSAAALLELADSRAEIAVVEAGLGGRLDATNVLESRVQVLTGVSLEHTRWLGSTIAAIAEEKLAVVRAGATLVVGADLHPDALRVAERVVREMSVRLVTAPSVESASFQARNFALAEAAAGLIAPVGPSAAGAALAETRVAGRLDVVDREPLTLLDGAHNPAGAQALAAALPGVIEGRAPLVIVLSVLEDKDAAGVLAPLVEVADALIFTRCTNPRALDPDELRGEASGQIVPEPRAALARAREVAGPAGAVLATGSIYLIADLLREAGDPRASAL